MKIVNSDANAIFEEAKTGDYTGKGVFTIVAECVGLGSQKGWGKLKSGRGWISLDYTEKM